MKKRILAQTKEKSVTILKCGLMQTIYRQARKSANISKVHAYFLTTRLDDVFDYFNKLKVIIYMS